MRWLVRARAGGEEADRELPSWRGEAPDPGFITRTLTHPSLVLPEA
jgi:hypothetical protein